MVTPRWVRTRTQPIAVADVVRYLVGVLDSPARSAEVFEIGGPEVLRVRHDAAPRGARSGTAALLIVPVPLLTPGLSSRWLALVTDVDTQAGRSLVDSMANEVVVARRQHPHGRAVRADGVRRRRARRPRRARGVSAAPGVTARRAAPSPAGGQPPVPAAEAALTSAGTSSARTTVASMRMPTPSAVPRTLMSVPGAEARAAKAKNRISAAEVTSRPVRPRPVTTAAAVSPGLVVLLPHPRQDEHLVVHRQAEQEGEDQHRAART